LPESGLAAGVATTSVVGAAESVIVGAGGSGVVTLAAGLGFSQAKSRTDTGRRQNKVFFMSL
jgi:hypothetical protein